MNEQPPPRPQRWYLGHTPQDLGELIDKQWARRSTYSEWLKRALMQSFLGLLFLFASKDFAESNWLQDEPQFKLALVTMGGLAAVGYAIGGVVNGVRSYINLNFLSQCCVLAGGCASALYLTGRSPLGPVWANLIFASFGCAFFEIVFGLWSVRRRDSEPIRRLKRVGQVAGVLMALFVAVGMGLFLAFSPSPSEGVSVWSPLTSFSESGR